MQANRCSNRVAQRLDGLAPAELRALALAAVRRAAGEVLDGSVGDDELVGSVAGWHRLMTAAHAEVLRRVGEVEQRGAFRGRAMSSTGLWESRLGVSRSEARTLVDSAAVLERMPAAAALHAAGLLGLGQVADAARTVAQLDKLAAAAPVDGGSTGAHEVAERAREAVVALDELVAAEAGGEAGEAGAEGGEPGGVGGEAALEDGAGVRPVGRQALRQRLEEFERTRAPELLAERERRLWAKRSLRLGRDMRDADQAPMLDGRLAPVTYAKARTVLHSLARKHAAGDARTFAQRCHDAFDRVFDIALASGELPDMAGEQPRVLLLVEADTVHERPGAPAARLDGYGPVSVPTARQICCDAEVTAVVKGDGGEILNVGRDRRRPSRAQRRAVFGRDGGCVGCGAPLGYCEVHHVEYWEHGGRTDVDKLVAVCWDCHARIHHCGWRVLRRPDGRFVLRPPEHREAAEHPPGDTGDRVEPPERLAV
jgi:hypothetical protein